MIRAYSIDYLIEKGELRVGSFIHYVSDYAEYSTNFENTGVRNSHVFRTKNYVPWVVVYIDKLNNQIDIMPYENLDNNVSLCGRFGFVNGHKELNIIASKIASNRELGTIARCPTIEDMNKISGHVPDKKKVKRYAYYPNNARISGECEYERNTYIETICDFDSEFYSYDGGGVEEERMQGTLKYRTPRYDKPVFVSESCYWYNMDSKIFQNATFWLASQSVEVDSDCANFGMHYVVGGCIGRFFLCDSCFYEACGWIKGIRPIVTLNSTLRLGVNDEIMNGKFPKTPFRIIV